MTARNNSYEKLRDEPTPSSRSELRSRTDERLKYIHLSLKVPLLTVKKTVHTKQVFGYIVLVSSRVRALSRGVFHTKLRAYTTVVVFGFDPKAMKGFRFVSFIFGVHSFKLFCLVV